MKVKNRIVAITGAGSGMGREMTFELLRRGARAMIDAIESGKSRITIGKDATFMDRLSRFNPQLAANLIYRNMKSLLKS